MAHYNVGRARPILPQGEARAHRRHTERGPHGPPDPARVTCGGRA
ncbi:hypothetical protein HMPREF9005_2405 [Actinomyces sp. oral taxon 178 str. F0338]|nr:hypothetical protein HMPREF9005_2405 [Actinomyces sp. oral taxon 178 str. F0338]